VSARPKALDRPAEVMEPRVLVIERATRRASGQVEQLLARRGVEHAVVFLEQVCTAEAPAEFRVEPGQRSELSLRDARTGEGVSTRRLRAVWAEALGLLRNPMTAFLGDDDMAVTLQAVGRGEAWLFGLSVLAALAHARLFLPQLVERGRANHRLYQLAAARDSGFSVPRTVVTAQAARVREALAPGEGERLHYQSFSPLAFTLRGGSYVSVDRFVPDDRLFALAHLRGPAVFSLWPPSRRRLQVAALGDELWAAEVETIDGGLDPDVTDLSYQAAQRNLR